MAQPDVWLCVVTARAVENVLDSFRLVKIGKKLTQDVCCPVSEEEQTIHSSLNSGC